MKKNRTENSAKVTSYLLVLALLLGSTPLYAQNPVKDAINKNANAIGNLVNGIKSDNEGLKRSSIYLAGYYKIEEVVPALTEQLHKEKNESNRLLIALTLNEIGTPEAVNVLKELSKQDGSEKVKRISNAVLIERANHYNTTSEYKGNLFQK